MGIGLEKSEFGLVGLDLDFALVFDEVESLADDLFDQRLEGFFVSWFLNLVDLFSERSQGVKNNSWELSADFLVAKLFVFGTAYEGDSYDSFQLVGILCHLFGELVGKSIVWIVEMD